MPRVHRNNLFLTVSPSTAESLQQIGVGQDRIRQICNGVEAPDPPTERSPEPMFLAFGRLADYKRLDLLLRLWDRVRHVTGGKLVIAGDGPERQRLQALAGARRRVHRPGVGCRKAPADVRGVAVPAPGADRGLGHRGRRGGDPRHSLGGVQRAGAA
jgi:glycosyltransferase involved in cell wall biosynthesis